MIVLALSGSLRAASYNSGLVRAAAELAPPGCRVEIGSIRELPLYDADLAARAFPAAVTALKEQIASSQGLLLATPEYNNSLPGPLKNAIDWASRPPADIPRVFHGRPVAMMGATTGLGATRLAQAAWLPVFRALGLVPWFGKQLLIPQAHEHFDESGTLTDEATRARLREFVEGFVAFVSKLGP
jgi:chromate reductase, NAD(P)H dehydrogenase (quinone)